MLSRLCIAFYLGVSFSLKFDLSEDHEISKGFTSINDALSEVNIVIVGAGISGIAAAVKLMENGHNNIVILEAEDRIGGRIHSVPFADGFIDLGAQSCHGERNNVIYEMVHPHFEFGRPEYKGNNSNYFLSSGQLANQEQCARLDFLLNKIYEKAQGQNKSLGSIISDEYEKALNTLEYSYIDKSLCQQMLIFFGKLVSGDYAVESWFDLSLTYANRYQEECEGSQVLSWKREGFKKVFDFLMKKLPDPAKSLDVESKVQLQKEVVNINWNPVLSNDKITVTCSDGSSYLADHLIFTASLGVLKDRHHTIFSPNLPESKIKAIRNIGFGTLGKVFLQFEQPFWSMHDKNLLLYPFLWTDEDLQLIKVTDKEWLTNLVAFLRHDSFPNVLEGFVTGSKMKEFEESSDDKIISDCMWLLEKFLAMHLPNPISMKRTRWMTNKNFLGSYAHFSMESERTRSTPVYLAQSLLNNQDEPKILFAGEATHEKHVSYTNGALSSGWRAADELLKFLGQHIRVDK